MTRRTQERDLVEVLLSEAVVVAMVEFERAILFGEPARRAMNDAVGSPLSVSHERLNNCPMFPIGMIRARAHDQVSVFIPIGKVLHASSPISSTVVTFPSKKMTRPGSITVLKPGGKTSSIGCLLPE